MAHRYPVHVSDKWHNELVGKYPAARAIMEEAGERTRFWLADVDEPPRVIWRERHLATWRAAQDAMPRVLLECEPDLLGREVSGIVSELIADKGKDWLNPEEKKLYDELSMFAFTRISQNALPSTNELVLLGEWERARQVLRYDPDFAKAVIDSTGALEVEPAVFDKLPYETFFVEHESTVRAADIADSGDGEYQVDVHDVRSPGFFVMHTAMWTPDAPDSGEHADDIMLIWIDGKGRRVAQEVLSVNLKSVAEMIDFDNQHALTDESSFAKSGFYDAALNDEAMEQTASQRLERVEAAMSLLLYLCSMEPEYEQAERGGVPKAGRKGGTRGDRLTGDTPITVVGSRIGEAIRVYERGGDWEPDGAGDVPDGEKGGRKVRPHIRRGHFHRHWRGPRGSRELVLMWHAPTFVNAELGTEPAVTTVHEVGGKRRKNAR